MKTIIICGPTSAGKNVVAYEILRETQKIYPGRVGMAQYFKTRDVRPDETDDGYYISETDFDKKRQSGEIPDWLWGQVSNYRVGYNSAEFSKSEIVIVNIDDKKARKLKELVQSQKGQSLSIFLHAPEEVRVNRFMRRENWLIYEPAEHRIKNDVTDPNPENYKDFDLVVENKEGLFAETMKEIMPAVKKFIETN